MTGGFSQRGDATVAVAYGLPAISVPCGFTKAGLPVGLQIVGHRGRTSALLTMAQSVEPHVDADSIASAGCPSRRSDFPTS